MLSDSEIRNILKYRAVQAGGWKVLSDLLEVSEAYLVGLSRGSKPITPSMLDRLGLQEEAKLRSKKIDEEQEHRHKTPYSRQHQVRRPPSGTPRRPLPNIPPELVATDEPRDVTACGIAVAVSGQEADDAETSKKNYHAHRRMVREILTCEKGNREFGMVLAARISQSGGAVAREVADGSGD